MAKMRKAANSTKTVIWEIAQYAKVNIQGSALRSKNVLEHHGFVTTYEIVSMVKMNMMNVWSAQMDIVNVKMAAIQFFSFGYVMVMFSPFHMGIG